MNARLTSQVTLANLLAVAIQLPVVFLVWPVLNATSWLKWTAYHEIVVPLACRLAVMVEHAAFRWALWLIIFAELYMIVQYSLGGKFGLNVAFN